MNQKQKELFYEFPIYGMTAEDLSYSHDNIKDVKDMLEAGIKVIQYREKKKTFKYMYNQLVIIRQMTKEAGAMLIVDDFVGLALAVGADGVHVGQEDIPVHAIRAIAPRDFIIGVSTHMPEHAGKAVEDGADYIGVGPIYATQTKEDVVDPVGLDYLDYVSANIHIPFVAIGGIKDNNVDDVFESGCDLACLVTGIVGKPDIKKTVRELKRIYDESKK
ncbi:MAG: thiamine phosphate synthase [Lachnospiraceae bacterium]|nr:thiamine phosphate synthase [Lachnospiraceae bacterium]